MMTADEYKQNNLTVAWITNTIESLPLADMLTAQANAGTIGPILDPTLYREKMNDFRIDMERARILRKAQASLEALRRSVS
jgi:hypothetical protein